jgi:PIN domain nuclease of toxin-antitoxin system
MNKIGTLLDTHAWIWLVANERHRASQHSWQEIDDAAKTNSLAVSEISFWEIATKAGKGKLEFDRDVEEWLREAASTPGVGVVEVERDTLVRSTLLELHRDPADRVLVATALRYGLRLATADVALLRYAERNRLLKVLDMRPDGP